MSILTCVNWKQRDKLKNINEKLDEVLSVKDCIDHEMKTHRKLDKLLVKKKELEQKINKMADTNAKDNFKISQKNKETHIQRTVLNYSQVEIPKDFSDLLSKGLDYKVAKKRHQKHT